MKYTKKITPEQEAEAVLLYQSGLSTGQVAKLLGFARETIRRTCINAGIAIRNHKDSAKLRLADGEVRKKMSESHKGIKREPHSDETKSKIAEARKREWQNPEYRAHQVKVRKGISRPGTPHSEESKAIISQKAKKRFEDPVYHARVTSAMNASKQTDSWKEKQSVARKHLWKTDEFKNKALEALTGKKETSLERKVRLCLEFLEVSFKQQHVIGRAIADFYIEPSLIIEADGKYWHDKPEVKIRDMRRDKWLQSEGYTVLRLDEETIQDDPIPRIREFLGI